MKNVKLLLVSMMLVLSIFMSSCGNSNVNDVAVNTNNETEVTTMQLEETTTRELETTTQMKEIIMNDEGKMVQEEVKKDILVAYFSATGTTKRVAEKIAELTGADIYEIVPANPYSEADLNWNDRNSRTTKEMDDPDIRPEIGSSDIDLTPYRTIYLGYPIWWGDAPRIMATFVEKYNFDGKKVIPFCTSGGSGIGRSGSNLGVLAGSGSFSSGERLNSGADTDSIQNFIDNNK